MTGRLQADTVTPPHLLQHLTSSSCSGESRRGEMTLLKMQICWEDNQENEKIESNEGDDIHDDPDPQHAY